MYMNKQNHNFWKHTVNVILFYIAEIEFGMTKGSSTTSTDFTATSIHIRISLVLLVSTSVFLLLFLLAYGSSKLRKHFKNRTMVDERSTAEENNYQTIPENFFKGSCLFYKQS